MIFESLSKLVTELRGRYGDAGRTNDLAVDVREWFTNDDSNNNQSDEQHTVHSSGDEERNAIVYEENEGDCAINYGDASLDHAEVSREGRKYNGDY